MRLYFETDYLEGWADSRPAKQRHTHIHITFATLEDASRRHEYLQEVLDLLGDMGFISVEAYGWNYRRRGTQFVLKALLKHPTIGNAPSVTIRVLKSLPKETSGTLADGLAEQTASP